MIKRILVIAALVAVIGVLVFGAINRTQAKTGTEGTGSGLGGYRHGNETISLITQTNESYTQDQGTASKGYAKGAYSNNSEMQASQLSAPAGELSAAESAALLYMREEEKLAHDVYVTMFAQWSLPIFQNISQSEQIHSDAIKTLLERYGLVDPASSELGVFSNFDLQTLFNDLIDRGSQSLAEALQAGAAIEEIDILDLQTHLAETDHADIQQVYDNLMNGSYNHLRAFVSTLNKQTGETYQPQYLAIKVYEAIIHTNTESGVNSSASGNGQVGYHGGRP
jgi:hypothetical protein